MEFESYSIIKESDNSIVPLNELDPLVCMELNLEYSDKDFGHFHFTEKENEISADQKSISWAGLLHVAAYYSKIKYGRCSSYDVEAAMAWVCQYAVTFPPSILDFTSRLMSFLSEHGLYVRVDIRHQNGKENEFTNDHDASKIYRNNCGIFQCWREDRLLKYYPDSRCLLNQPKIKYKFNNLSLNPLCYSPSISELIIPSGIKSIDMDFFREGYVESPVELPNTLEELEGFNEAYIEEFTIPANVKKIGFSAFNHCKIKKLILARIHGCEFDKNAFCNAEIENLYIPEREILNSTELPFLNYVTDIRFY